MRPSEALSLQADLGAVLSLSRAVTFASDVSEIGASACRIACERLGVSHSSFEVFNDDHTRGLVVAEYPMSVGAMGMQIPIYGNVQDDLVGGGREVLEVSDAADLADGPITDIMRRLL